MTPSASFQRTPQELRFCSAAELRSCASAFPAPLLPLGSSQASAKHGNRLTAFSVPLYLTHSHKGSMKLTAIALLKFNALMVGLMLVGVLTIETSSNGRAPDTAGMMIFAVLLLSAWFWGNLKIFIHNKSRIANSIKNGALDVAASAIQFKEAAKARAQERTEEKYK